MNKKLFIVSIVLFFTSSSNLLLFNDPPDVIVETSPVVYSGVPFGHSDEYDLEELIIKIYASDPDGDDIQVLVMFGFPTWEEFATDMLYDYREQLGLMVKTEMALTAHEVYIVGREAMAQVAPPQGAPQLTTPWYELIELEQGFYEIAVDLNLLDVDGQLKGVDVYVQVIDERKNISEEEVYIPIDVRDHPGAANLLSPPANPDYICPPQPVFTWIWPNDENLKSYQFHLAEGKDNIWERGLLSRITSTEYSWRCDINNECSEEYAPDHIFITSWTPPKPLKAGTYSWGIAASYDSHEQKFNPPASDRTPSFQFTVAPNLSGDQCISSNGDHPISVGSSSDVELDESNSHCTVETPSQFGDQDVHAIGRVDGLWWDYDSGGYMFDLGQYHIYYAGENAILPKGTLSVVYRDPDISCRGQVIIPYDVKDMEGEFLEIYAVAEGDLTNRGPGQVYEKLSICPDTKYYVISPPCGGISVGETVAQPEPEPTKTPTRVPEGTYLGNARYGYVLYYSDAFSEIVSPNAPLMIIDPIEGLELVDQQYLSGTNLKRVQVGIGATSNSSIVSECLTSGEDEIINSIPFKKVEFSEAGAGSVYWQINYRTLQNDICYEIGFVIAYGNMDMYASGTVVEFNQSALIREINQLISTFSILE